MLSGNKIDAIVSINGGHGFFGVLNLGSFRASPKELSNSS